METLKYFRLTNKAYAPYKSCANAAGFDLRSAYFYNVTKGGRALIKTDLVLVFPEGTYGRIAPRSGLALEKGIQIGGGVVDYDYRGNVGIIVFNHGDEDFTIRPGDRVAQIICEMVCYPIAEEINQFTVTERNESGFGSSGIN